MMKQKSLNMIWEQEKLESSEIWDRRKKLLSPFLHIMNLKDRSLAYFSRKHQKRLPLNKVISGRVIITTQTFSTNGFDQCEHQFRLGISSCAQQEFFWALECQPIFPKISDGRFFRVNWSFLMGRTALSPARSSNPILFVGRLVKKVPR